MARVTVEDCVLQVPNRFELVMLAAQRAREVSGGAPITLERDNDKNPVVALREIAEVTVSLDELRDSMIAGLQRHVEQDEPEEEDNLELLMRRNLEQVAAASESEKIEIPTPKEDLASAAEEEQAAEPAAEEEQAAEPAAEEEQAAAPAAEEEQTAEPAAVEADLDGNVDAPRQAEDI